MAHTKAQGSSGNGRDSAGKRLGMKCFAGEIVPAGTILVRQRGTKFFPGRNVGRGRDDTLYARINGTVKFESKSRERKEISIYPVELGELGSEGVR